MISIEEVIQLHYLFIMNQNHKMIKKVMNKKPKNKERKFYYSLRMMEFKFCSFCRLVVKEYNRKKLLFRILSKI